MLALLCLAWLAPAAHARPKWKLIATGGTTDNLFSKRKPYASRVTIHQKPDHLRGVAVCRATPRETSVFAIYRNGVVSQGRSDNLGAVDPGNRIRLPKGLSGDDIVGFACKRSKGKRQFLLYFKNGTYYAFHGTGRLGKARPYQLPLKYDPQDIIGVGADDKSGMVCAWYRDGYVSCGTHDDLDRKRQPYKYKAAYWAKRARGVGIDGKTKLVIAWYRAKMKARR